ncbi:hypothetical protein [Methylomonas sp. ZR1]|uniref:hypothetical protein n=1 Tax=Methylomonas sp. ZR1 TaxID=1797072 RepID=UPI0014911C12|nr:hypothetical protein [Methylomonas sp. ZR1]NOV29256.1 hypothetical protein [Methylomonas sp. ZR1]
MTNKNISSADVNPGKKLSGKQWGLIHFDQELERLISARQECSFENLTQEDAEILAIFAERVRNVASTLYLTSKPIKH